MANYGFLAFIDMCIQVLLPLVYSTSISMGGLGFDAYRIGTIMGAWGFINAIVQGLLIGPTVRRFGARKTFIAAQMSFVVIIGLYPVMVLSARRAGRVDATVWVVLIIQLILQLSRGLAYGVSHLRSFSGRHNLMSVISGAGQVLIVNSASRAALGTTIGMAQAMASLMRSIAPSVASSLFSISLQEKLAGGNMVYFILIGVAFVGVRVSVLLPQNIDSTARNE
jgi:MFS family permease